MIRTWCFLLLTITLFSCGKTDVDVLVIGGGTGGTAAGIQAARQGAKTVIAEEFDWLGGMLTSAGTSIIEGNYELPSGLLGEFRKALIKHYGSEERMQLGWASFMNYEPAVGDSIFKAMAAAEKDLQVWYKTTLVDAKRENDYWRVTLSKAGVETTVTAHILIDGTELGDVAKLCGATYDLGMDSRAETQEEIAPDLANDIIQDLTYVAILKDYGKDVTIPMPESYDPTNYYCACQTSECVNPKDPQRVLEPAEMIAYGALPNKKYMINWSIEGNDYYLNVVEKSPKEREEALKAAKNYTLGFVYFIQTELGYNTLGLADDEYPTTDKLPFYPYHREGRRIHGEARFTLNHVIAPYEQSQPLYRTGIAVGDYPIDHRHDHYNGTTPLPDLKFEPIDPYSVPMGALIPRNIDGLIMADKAISVSNLANGMTRFPSVILQVGQAAGALAAHAIDLEKPIKDVSVRLVQQTLLDAHGFIYPIHDLNISNIDIYNTVQRICATGLLRTKSIKMGWDAKNLFKGENILICKELKEGMKSFYPDFDLSWIPEDEGITIYNAMKIAYNVMDYERKKDFRKSKRMVEYTKQNWAAWGFNDFNEFRVITRLEFAVMFDKLVQPFKYRNISCTGEVLE